MASFSLLPILMVADSSLLYTRKSTGNTWLCEVIRTILSSNQITAPKCASLNSLTSCYIGANNGDEEAFFEIFQGAIVAAGFDSNKCHFVKSCFDPFSQVELLSKTDILFISGGNPLEGWNKLKKNEKVIPLILERYKKGELVLIGSSAGAMQMGNHLYDEESHDLINPFQLVPAIFGMHEDGPKGGYWKSFSSHVKSIHSNNLQLKEGTRFLGLCWSGALLYYPQSSQFVPLNKDLIEFSYDPNKGEVVQTVIPATSK